MSYDLAVWSGPAPANDEAAGEEFERRADATEGEATPASPEIEAFVQELLGQYPDLGETGDAHSPWAAGPLLEEASGGFIYFAMTYPGAQQAMEFIVGVADRHRLVCFDPQAAALLVPTRIQLDGD